MNDEEALEDDSIMEMKEAHFLKPIATSTHEQHQPTLNNPSSSSTHLKINFKGWSYPHSKWAMWVDQLKLKYESVWKKAGIFEAIMSTKSRIRRNQDLLYGVVEKWCSETNTFVFPFGEASITLEDVMVLGGYSLIGDPIFKPLEDQKMKKVEKKLIDIACKNKSEKSNAPSTSKWMDIFIGKGKEIEHEAFLLTWLSIFVFPVPQITLLVKRSLFPIAIHLARGNPIALGPAFLATIYKDLCLFKEKIVGLNKCSARGDKLPLVLVVNVQSPFYLVQVWIWERFKNLQPKPKPINNGDPLLLKWHQVMALKIDNVRLALDSAIDDFIWRPYVNKCGMFYPKDEILVPFKKDLLDKHKHMLSYVTCLRVSELVGFESIEQYLPHRVAMQFGMDQDVPGYVSRFNETNANAWENYCRPFSDTSLYLPSRVFEADITTRYAKWWKKSVLGPHNIIESSSKYRPHAEIPKLDADGGNIDDDVPSVKDGKKSGGKTVDDADGENIVDDEVASVQDGMKSEGNFVDDDGAPSSSIPTLWKIISSENSVEDGLIVEKNVDSHVPLISVEDGLIAEKDVDPNAPSLPQTLTPLISVEDCEHVLEDYANESKEAKLSSDPIGQSETQTESYNYLSKVSVAELEEKNSGLEKVYTELKKQRLLQ